METRNLADELRSIRDDLVAQRRLIEADAAKAQTSKEKIQALLDSLDDEKMDKLEKFNIFVRQLKVYDLERTLIDKEYAEKFHTEYMKVIHQIKEMAQSVVRSK